MGAFVDLRSSGVPPNPDRLWIGETIVLEGTTISGIELQGAWQINDRLNLRGFYELINSRHGPYSSFYCCNPEGSIPGGVDHHCHRR